MPIKINLLAEAQALEEQRRKDPVKRAIAIGALLVVAMLVWAGVLYSKNVALQSQQKAYDDEWKANEKRFVELTRNQQMIRELSQKVEALDRFHTNRFLWGSTLNAFQQTIPAALVDKIQLTRLNGVHEFQTTEAVAAKKKNGAVVEAARPASSRERITIKVEGRDFGNPAEQTYNKYKSAIVSVPFFKGILSEDAILLQNVSLPVRDLVEQKEYVQFTLECKLPVMVRNE